MSDEEFVVHVAHIITDPFNVYTDMEKLHCIKLRYLQMAFPEYKLSQEQINLIGRIK
jgi:hypothetical protein